MRDEELTTISSREVGARMRRAREERGLSAADLAGKIGGDEDHIPAGESGQGAAPHETLQAIAAALATNADSFVS